jgi:4-hydroxy-2-oxoheptanedioate aldolase
MSSLKERLRNCEQIAGMHVFLKDPCITELCASLGYDFLWIDTEHTAIDYAILERHLIAAKAGGTDTIVRVPWNDQILIKRVLEMGATGIILPVINTVEELDYAMKSTLYPPLGFRGFGPMRAIRYGVDDSGEYVKRSNQELVRCVQIESYIAVDNLKEMVKNPYVDCFIFGPNDLSGSIGELGNVFSKNTNDLIDKGIDILKSAGKSIGVSSGDWNPKTIEYWHNKGINVLSMGIDYLHILKGAQDELNAIHSIQKGK